MKADQQPAETRILKDRGALWRSWTVIFVLALNNLACAPIEKLPLPKGVSTLIWAACVGVMISQVPLHAIWCVFAPIGFRRRLGMGIVVAFGLFCSAALGYAIVADDGKWVLFALPALFFLPLVAIAFQTPLWTAKYLLRWRVVSSSHGVGGEASSGFGIRDMLVATSALAIALSATLLAAPFASPQDSSTTFLMESAVESLVMCVVSAVTTGPVLVATLRTRRLWVALLVLLFLDAALTTASIIGLFGTVPEAALAGWRMSIVVVAMWSGFFGALTVCMLVVRQLGLRLVWGNEGIPVAADTQDTV